MNRIVEKFLLAGDKFKSEMNLRQSGLHIMLVGHLLKAKKEYKHLKEKEIQGIFTRIN